mmetsp:Transcript_1367/g.1839  ORF Transcript_1367/g.1839 Transcript_1367/m.1839 type:complete len:162 (+) Transcript_1367:210-695(+)
MRMTSGCEVVIPLVLSFLDCAGSVGSVWMRSFTTVHAHFEGSRHDANYRKNKKAEVQSRNKQINEMLGEKQKEMARLQESKTIESRLTELGLESWRTQMKSALYDYVANDQGYPALKLEEFLKLERLSLLELALWKINICSGLTFQTVQEMREYVYSWREI